MAHGQIYWIGVIFCRSNNSTRLHMQEHGKKPQNIKKKTLSRWIVKRERVWKRRIKWPQMAHGQIYWIGVIFCGSNNSTRLHMQEHSKKLQNIKKKTLS